MSRILFWTALICLVVFAIRSKIRSAQKRAEQQMREAQQRQQAPAPGAYPPHASSHAKQAAIEAETMLACAHCGVFFPASEAVRFDGAIYCSKAHAALPTN